MCPSFSHFRRIIGTRYEQLSKQIRLPDTTLKPHIVKRDQKRAWMKAGKTNDRFAYVADNDSGHAKIICFHA